MRPWTRREAERSERLFLRAFRDDAAREQKRRCAYCREPMSAATADHVKPRSRGGTTDRANIVACCAPCNRAKASLSVAEFKSILASRELPPGLSYRLMMAWSRTHIWKSVERARRRINKAAGVA